MHRFEVPEILRYQEDTTLGKVEYNSFCDLIEADDYHARRLNNSGWRTADEDTKNSALYHATDILHRQKWMGAPTETIQALAWPRKYVPNRLTLSRDNGLISDNYDYLESSVQYLDENTVPQFLRDATAELANYLMVRAATGKNEASQYSDQLSSLSLGGGAVSLSFREEAKYVTDMPHQVFHIIKDFLSEVTEIDESVRGAYTASIIRS
jgi:hypothetical protein